MGSKTYESYLSIFLGKWIESGPVVVLQKGILKYGCSAVNILEKHLWNSSVLEKLHVVR